MSLEGPSDFLSTASVSLRDFSAKVHTIENETLSDLRPEGMKDFPIMTSVSQMKIAPVSITGKRIKRTGKEKEK